MFIVMANQSQTVVCFQIHFENTVYVDMNPY